MKGKFDCCNQFLHARLYQESDSMLRQLWDNASYTVFIENNGVASE